MYRFEVDYECYNCLYIEPFFGMYVYTMFFVVQFVFLVTLVFLLFCDPHLYSSHTCFDNDACCMQVS